MWKLLLIIIIAIAIIGVAQWYFCAPYMNTEKFMEIYNKNLFKEYFEEIKLRKYKPQNENQLATKYSTLALSYPDKYYDLTEEERVKQLPNEKKMIEDVTKVIGDATTAKSISDTFLVFGSYYTDMLLVKMYKDGKIASSAGDQIGKTLKGAGKDFYIDYDINFSLEDSPNSIITLQNIEDQHDAVIVKFIKEANKEKCNQLFDILKTYKTQKFIETIQALMKNHDLVPNSDSELFNRYYTGNNRLIFKGSC